MNVEIIKLKTIDGTVLDGFLKFGTNKSESVIIAVHGIASNCFKDREKMIAQKAEEHNIDTFVFNNRGSDIARYLKKDNIKPGMDSMGGCAYENPYESYYDIKSAILKMIEYGYKKIYLCGHSLGSSKILYTYNRLNKENDEIIDYIKGVSLLSLVDLESCFKFFAKENYENYINYAKAKMQLKCNFEMMPANAFMHPLSVRTYLYYTENNDELNIARYADPNYDFKELNSIKVPLFMRWGTDNEFIAQTPEELINILKEKVNNPAFDIGFIQGANHNYRDKEEILAEEILNFIENIK